MPKPTIDLLLATVTKSTQDLAQSIFSFTLATGQAMPSREKIESAVKDFLMEFLEPARKQAIANGTPEREVEAYAQVVTSHAQVAFQTKWAEMDRLLGEGSNASDGALH